MLLLFVISQYSRSFLLYPSIIFLILFRISSAFLHPVNVFIQTFKISNTVSTSQDHPKFWSSSLHGIPYDNRTIRSLKKKNLSFPLRTSSDGNTVDRPNQKRNDNSREQEEIYRQRKLRPGIPNLSKERDQLPVDFYKENPFDKFALGLFRQLVQKYTAGKNGDMYVSPFEGKLLLCITF